MCSVSDTQATPPAWRLLFHSASRLKPAATTRSTYSSSSTSQCRPMWDIALCNGVVPRCPGGNIRGGCKNVHLFPFAIRPVDCRLQELSITCSDNSDAVGGEICCISIGKFCRDSDNCLAEHIDDHRWRRSLGRQIQLFPTYLVKFLAYNSKHSSLIIKPDSSQGHRGDISQNDRLSTAVGCTFSGDQR